MYTMGNKKRLHSCGRLLAKMEGAPHILLSIPLELYIVGTCDESFLGKRDREIFLFLLDTGLQFQLKTLDFNFQMFTAPRKIGTAMDFIRALSTNSDVIFENFKELKKGIDRM